MPRFAANLSLMFADRPFLDRFAAAAEAGFTAVEFLFPYDHPVEAVARRVAEQDLVLALFNLPPGDWELGERGLAALPEREARFAAAVETGLAYAEMLRPTRLHVMAGIAEGPAARACYVENLRRACAAAPERVFVVEPINHRDMPGYHLSRVDDALRVIEAVDAPNLRLQLDLYHAQIMEGDLTRLIERVAPALGHVQIAGVPDRAEPDTGELNADWLFETLDRVGYDGFVGCEYRPAGRTEDGLGWLARWR